MSASWSVVSSKTKTKKKVSPSPKLHMVQVPRDDWCDEFTDTDRRIFLMLSKIFPKGLTAESIAKRLNASRKDTESPILTAADVGDLFYGDKEDVSDELTPYVIPVDSMARPKRWRIKATTDP